MFRQRSSRLWVFASIMCVVAAVPVIGQMDWQPLSPTSSPSTPRSWHAMAYDVAGRKVVLFGGFHVQREMNDTWLWDGSNWTACNPAMSPSARSGHVMAHDMASGRTVLFGGRGGTNSLNDTWEWDGQNWKQCSPTTSPPARSSHGMAYDAARQRVVLFGGHQGGVSYLKDTWEWDGQNWNQCKPATSPPARGGHPMACDLARGSVVMFGGWDQASLFNRTWTYTPTDLTASAHLVSVATGGNVTLALNAGTGHGGKPYFVAGCMDGGAPRGMPLGKVTLLLNTDGYFWFTVLCPNTLIANSIGVLDGSGKATATVQVPRLSPVLIGLRFYHAFIAFRSSIDYASTPVPLTLGP